MSVRTAKRGKSSHEQKRVPTRNSGLLFMSGIRGAAGGLLFVKPKSSKSRSKPKPAFEHSTRGGYR